MTKSVTFRVDDNSEMVEIYIDNKFWQSGNFWDFDFVRDVPDLLDKLGVKNYQEEYSYGDDEGEEE